MIRTEICEIVIKIEDKKSKEVTIRRHVLVVFMDNIKINISLVYNPQTGEEFVKLTKGTNAVKLLKYLLIGFGFKKLNPYRLFKSLEAVEGAFTTVSVYVDLITYLYVEGKHKKPKSLKCWRYKHG